MADYNFKLLMIFKLNKKGLDYIYKFDSLAMALSDSNLDYGIIAGKFKGKMSHYFDRILDSGDMLFDSKSKVIIGSPLRNTSGYAYYEVPFSAFTYMSNNGITEQIQQLQAIDAIGQTTELVWHGMVNPSAFESVKKDLLEKDIKSEQNIIDMLLGKDTGALDLPIENTNTETTIQRINKNSIQGRSEITYSKSNDRLQTNQTEINRSNTDVNEVIKQIKDKIIGQDEAVEAVVSNIYANQRIIETGNKDLISTQKASILLDGPTGTGKTAIIKEVADKLSLPIIITSSTAYSSTGYVGGNLTDILVKLLEKTKGNLELAQRGIVCLDEIDKLGQNSNEKDNLKMKTAVQQELLAFISGAKFDITYKGKNIEFDTSNLTFIGMGAFTKLREQKIAEKLSQSQKHTTIGFASTNSNEQEQNNDKTYVMTAQDYINFGLERELIGRFSLLTSTKAYSVEDYKNILVKSSISPLKMFIEFTKSFGINEVTYDEDFIQMMAEMAYRDNFGARGLQKIVSDLKNSLLLEIMNSKSKTINLTTEMLKKSEEKNIRSF